MRLWQVGLQLRRLLRESAGFFATLPSRIKGVADPAFQLRVARERERKFRVELDGPRVKLLALFQFLDVLHPGHKKIVRLDKREIGFAILRRLALDPRLFTRRKFRL